MFVKVLDVFDAVAERLWTGSVVVGCLFGVGGGGRARLALFGPKLPYKPELGDTELFEERVLHGGAAGRGDRVLGFFSGDGGDVRGVEDGESGCHFDRVFGYVPVDALDGVEDDLLNQGLALFLCVLWTRLLWLGREGLDRSEDLEDLGFAKPGDGDVLMTSVVGFDDGGDDGGVLEDVVVCTSHRLDRAVWMGTTLNDRANEDDRWVVKDVINACVDRRDRRVVEAISPLGLGLYGRDDRWIVKDWIECWC